MGTKRIPVALSVELHARIKAIAEQRDRSVAHNLIPHPFKGRDTDTTLPFVIERAITEFEAHMRRSSYAAKKAARARRLEDRLRIEGVGRPPTPSPPVL